jgi:hypothetical protein
MNPVRMAAALTVAVTTLGVARPAQAQLNGQHIKGSAGLKSGSQAGPGTYVVAPLLYFYQTDEIKDRDGNSLPTTADLNASCLAPGSPW